MLFSNDGSELLVSYCADYVYLFNLLGQRMVYSKHDGTDQATNGFHSAENGAQRNVPPLKRLRHQSSRPILFAAGPGCDGNKAVALRSTQS